MGHSFIASLLPESFCIYYYIARLLVDATTNYVGSQLFFLYPLVHRSVLAPHVARYNAFWSFWAGKARGSSVAVELFNLNIDNSTRQTLELTILHEFLVYMRCGPSQQVQTPLDQSCWS